MPSGINSYAFCADYSNIARCLFAIQSTGSKGAFANDPEALRLISIFEGDVLRKLYNRTIRVLGTLQGVDVIPEDLLGDFEYLDFSEIDFNVGLSAGDFGYIDFSNIDFSVNSGYGSRFQIILNLFAILCSHSSELSDADIQSINAALVPVLNAFWALQRYLIQAGLNPCDAVPTYFNNSPNLYLQAAGSDGSNDIAQGIHLRWSLAGDLGSNHLPQGDYYNGSLEPIGYNKTNDYVILSRTPYVNPVIFTIDFETALPAIDYSARQWTYILNLFTGNQQITNIFRLTFKDITPYNQAAAATDPQTNPFGFLQLYNGLIEIEIDNKNSFSVGYDFRLKDGQAAAMLKFQAISVSNINGVSTETINIRKTITATSSGPVTGAISGDNILKTQLQTSSGGFLQSLSFETYDDFITTRVPADWTTVGDEFSLSTTDQLVFDRLEAADYPINNLWPQYNDGMRVKVANYHDKWSVSHPNDFSIKETVQQYLVLSETDPRAEDVVKDDGAGPDDPGLLVSYLDILNLLAMDYHWARMLGLGHIDTQVNNLETVQYIYKVSYTNRQSPDSPNLLTFEYISLPTGKTDSRLPEAPVMRPLSYTMPVDNGLTGGIFNEEGYATNAHVRLVNIGREPYNFELTAPSFFGDISSSGDFNVFENTDSILYGIKYRPIDQQNYVKPEITSNQGNPTLWFEYFAYDSDFPGGVLETAPVPDNQTSLYIHLEKQTGIHAYAIYGINWFARASVISNESETNATVFPVNNTLVPPAGISVQYIQKEDTLLFTTATEQDWLSGRAAEFPGQDIGFTRVTFNWLDLTDISYVSDITTFDFSNVIKPTRVKAWFKPGQPLQVVGVITNIMPVAGDPALLLLNTGNYSLLDGSLINPLIAETDLSRFTGSLLATPEGQFAVVSVAEGTSGPVFTVKKIVQTTTVEDPYTPGSYATKDDYILPAFGSRFTVTENLSDPANWQPITKDVQLIDYADPLAPVMETSIDDEGNITRYLIGGITGSAIILGLNDTGGQPMPGYYSVTFDPAVALAPHPQSNLPFDPDFPDANAPGALHSPDVEWYNGQIRIPVAGDPSNKKLLNVIRILQADPLQVYVYDAAYQDDTIQVSVTGTDLVDQVNFHPGYKVYLFPEPPPDNSFNGTNILPPSGQKDKKTLIGLQAADTGMGRSGFVSSVSAPAILMARKIEVPVQLDTPMIYGLKVRPDATTKAALTFDMKIAPDSSGAARNPFGFMFYRTTNEDVLAALYAPATVSAILASLSALMADDHFDQRYLELVNLIFDPENPGNFNVFDATPNPYGFPVPDKANLTESSDSQEIKTNKYLSAILSTLLPLTAQTPIFSFLKQGYQTENKLPTIRTIDGNLIDPSDPSFDPFPMIRQYTSDGEANTTYIRVTDYTLNGSSRFLYFYGGSEVTNQLAIGPLSPFAGPVTILHTLPADPPVIRYFTLGPPAIVSTSPVAVAFYISPFYAEDPINKIRIYRTYNQNKALSLQTMDSHTDLDIVIDTQNGIVTADTFPDLATVPFGEVIYYRLAFIRTIINEREVSEDVVGLASDIVVVNLINTINPLAPDLIYDEVASTLTWLPTTNKGTYNLYAQNSRGNWQKIYIISPASSTDPMEFTLTPPLVLTDGDGKRIYHRYKVKVENSSGLLNLVDNELTI
jgi:hypothetical protein